MARIAGAMIAKRRRTIFTRDLTGKPLSMM
jgi:hypothetical protein